MAAVQLRVVFKECIYGAYSQWQTDRVAPWPPGSIPRCSALYVKIHFPKMSACRKIGAFLLW